MKLTMEETQDSEFLVLPVDALIQVAVDGIELRDVPGRDGKAGWQKLAFRFKIIDLPSSLVDKYAVLIGSTIWGSVSARFTDNPDNKLRKWAEALLDIGELNPGFELETNTLIGRKARAQVGNYPRRESGFGHQIVGLLPLVAQQPAPDAQPSFPDDPPF